MQSNFISYFFTNEIMHALFLTLMHSLWQSIVLALIAAILLMYTKKCSAALRYKLLGAILISFIFISIVTFCYEINSIGEKHNGAFKNVSAVTNYNVLINAGRQENLTEKIISVFKLYENFIVLAWFIIISLKCINLLSGLRNIYLLKSNQVFDAGEYWNHRLKELAVKAGITKQVTILRSAIAKVPMVLGHLKPVILFPAAALTALAPEEVEAILLHELAHIRRKDYLLNILQTLTEIIFFFNPAVLWISSLIKEERESCCDDIAVRQIKNKKQFIRALVSFQEYNLASKYAASFSGRRNYLLNRVKRIITNNNKTLNNMEKIFLACGIIITGFAAVAFSLNSQSSFANTTAAQHAKTFVSSNKKDTVPQTVNSNESKYIINTTMDGKQYRLEEVNGKVTELYVDNIKVADNKLPEYKSVIEKLTEKMDADKEKQTEKMKAQHEALAEQQELMKKNLLVQKEEMEKQAEDIKKQAKKLQNEMMKNEMGKQTEEMEAQKKELAAQTELMKKNMLDEKEEMEKQVEEMKKQAQELEKEMHENNIEKDTAQTMKEKALLMKDQKAYLAKAMQAQKKALAAAKAEAMEQKTAMMEDQKKYLAQAMQVQKEVLAAKTEAMKQQVSEMKDQIEKQAEKIKEQEKELMQSLNEKQQTP